MNPRVSYLTLILFLLFSCTTEKKEETISEEPLVKKTLLSEIDTFYAGGTFINISDTSESAFSNFFITKPDSSELNNLKQNPDVKRNGDTLFITLRNDTVKQLISKPYVEGSDDVTEYKYLGKLKGINYHLIYVALYEAFTYLVINAENGKEAYLCGVPAVSPNSKYLAASCFDLQAGFVFNGIQMYEITKDSLKMDWSRELGKWGADHITWMDNHTLLAEKMYLDTSQNIHTGFVKIVYTK